MNLLIKNANIVDGTAKAPFKGHILINDDLITAVVNNGAEVISETRVTAHDIFHADGLYVTPGFIDMHTHTDWANFVAQGLKPKVMQGITTEVVGQCGFSMAPMLRNKQHEWRSKLIIGNPPMLDWEWEDMSGYLTALSKHGLESNLVPFVGHNTLRFAVAESAARPLNSEEIVQCAKLLEASFAAGVFGLSLGLIYIPGIFANYDELKTIIKIVAQHNGLLTVHLRSESDELIEALEAMVELVTAQHCKLHISHLKAIGKNNWHKLTEVLKIIDTNKLTFDHYPYTAGSTSLLSIFPPFMLQEATTDIAICKLSEPKNRSRLKKLFSGAEQQPPGIPWDNLPKLVGWENIVITAVELQDGEKSVKTPKTSENTNAFSSKYIGKNLLAIAAAEHKDPTDVAVDLIVAARGNVRMIDYHSTNAAIVEKLQHHAGMIGTDTLYGGKLHPRVTGTYPRLFKNFVFDHEIITLETMVAQMTSRPATVLGLENRGYIAPGYKADLTFFDCTFTDRSTFTNPEKLPQGLKHVMINGKFKVQDGEYKADVRSGVVIKKK